uniref:FYVE-type domain-containing protein n=1 Tax=Leersia perrieri TaxID=77586 RepID=A0A0D9VJL2_9ORYZ
MAGGFEGRSPATRGVEQALVALKKGAHLLKCGKRGKPKLCPFRLSSDEKMLIWYSKEREKRLIMSSVSSVVFGHKTICKDRDQAECWYVGLTALLSVPCSPVLLIDSTSSRRINSCSNSPPSYIQQRSRLFAVHDTRKFKQVHSIYGSPRLMQKNVLSSNLDCSEPFFSPRQGTCSDLDSYIEKVTPEVINRVKNSYRDIPVAEKLSEQIITQMPKQKSSEGLNVANGTNSLKDIFVWGDVPGNVLDHGDVSKANVILPRLLNMSNIFDVQNVACGEKHAAIVTKHGEVFSWGVDKCGRLGHKVSVNVSDPKIIESLTSTRVKAIAFGSKHTCAVSVSGELFEWGEGNHSLGLWSDQYQRNQWFPHKLIGPFDGISILKIACGHWHTAIISSSGQLFTYGDGTFGVLGHGDTQSVAQPKQVESLKGLRAKAIACGPWHTAAIVERIGTVKSNAPSGKLFTWGDADRGKLGHADKRMKLVSCAKAQTIVLTITGVVFTIGGSKERGRLGNPLSEETSICLVEGPLKTEFVREISSGSSHVAVLTMNGKVFTWGKGTEGQLGLGDYVDRTSPTLVEALEDKQVQSIACGSNFTIATCLHKPLSSKDQFVCSNCQLAFGFTRKKHNCYNCGSMFCNSCSNNKVSRAALAPDKSKRYRVCDACFSQMHKVEQHSKLGPQLKIQKDEVCPIEIRSYTPKLARIFREANAIMEKMASAQSPHQRSQNLDAPDQVKTLRWGLVECPSQFRCVRDSIPYSSTTNKQTITGSVVKAMNETMAPKPASILLKTANDSRVELDLMENILLEEVKQLQEQVTALAKQCRHRSLKVQLYKRKVEETWLIARNEAARCKAAKDIIKVLTDQHNLLSKNLLAGEKLDSSRIMPSHTNSVKSVQAELPDPPDEDVFTGEFQQPKCNMYLHNSKQVDRGCTRPSNAFMADDSVTHQNGQRTSNGNTGYTEGTNATTAPTDPNGVIEQIERGVYATVVTSPSGNKCIKRIRFSRKHFGEEQAQKWWEANEGMIFTKYSSMEQTAR